MKEAVRPLRTFRTVSGQSTQGKDDSRVHHGLSRKTKGGVRGEGRPYLPAAIGIPTML